MSEQKRIAAIVLAAGKSERMQYPKTLLIFGKETALDRVIRICAEAGCDPVIVVLGHEVRWLLRAWRERVRQNASLEGAVLLHNEAYETGRTSSLQTGLRALPPDAAGFLIFPVDHPLVEVGTVASLVSAYQEGGGAVLAPTHEGRKGHPVLCDRVLAAEFLSLAPDAPARLVTGSDPDRVVSVETNDLEIFGDLDEPADYHRALEVYSARGGEAGFLAPKGAGRPAPKRPPV